jgi:flagellar basal-body rod modification protein FlgD
MEVTQIQAPSAGRDTIGREASTRALSSDFETFLKMLTVQMQNQDPLNPLESTDFAVQLATFSGVEQQVRTNDILADLAASLGGSAISQFAQWVGQEVRGKGAAFFDGAPVPVTVPQVPGADAADLLVRDQSGRTVDRVPLDVGGGEIEWSGISSTGQPFLRGFYTFAVESRAGSTILGETPADVRGIVREARIGDAGAIELVLDGGAVMAAGDVRSLRQIDR